MVKEGKKEELEVFLKEKEENCELVDVFHVSYFFFFILFCICFVFFIMVVWWRSFLEW